MAALLNNNDGKTEPAPPPRLINYAGDEGYKVVGEHGKNAVGSRDGGGGWLVPELARMTFLSVMSVVICVEHGLVVVDTACTVGECLS